MKKNVNVRTHSYFTVVQDSFKISQQIAGIFIYLGLYNHIAENEYDWTYPVSGIIIHTPAFTWSMITSSFLFLTVIIFIIPLMKNLTVDISTDTIWAMTLFMFIVNLLFHDYSLNGKFEPMSINAAMFVNVLLSSRLPDNYKVLLLLLCGISLFALFPIFIRAITKRYPKIELPLTILVCFCSLILNETWGYIVVVYIFITFVCPWLFVEIQKYKNEIRGPWDEAVINRSSSAEELAD
ncbi:hypothetical protein HDV04_005457 [Boothiomyces sp. JEL0838]|nr:hypothetical protein HDV04_005440 [Boothiomyces sp. JEL0838]KAJ3310034.1 hypothetical protein HDV04_005457 [Boothiomyces sp. JEL0838]